MSDDLTMPEAPTTIFDELADEAPDVPLDESAELPDMTPDPTPDDDAPVLPAPVAAVIRTAVPYIIAGLVWLLARVGLDIPLPEGMDVFLTTLIGTGYYALARVLEKRWPQIPWLGSTRQPLYTAPARLVGASPLASSGYVWWRGGKFSPAFRDSLADVDKEVPGFVLTQGGFNGTVVEDSGGTHGGDAADFSVRGKTYEQVKAFIYAHRQRGNFASFRTTKVAKWGVRAQGFTSYHVHIVPNGWAMASLAARRQIAYIVNGVKRGYRYGRDGLASNGADVGPGHTAIFRTRTWYGYLTAKSPAVGLPASGSAGPIPRSYTPKPWPAIAEDGKLGPLTLARLQMQLSVARTGKLDHFTIRALKVWLGLPDDGVGILYPSAIRALQKRTGAYVDGIWQPTATTVSPTTRALQRYLNGHR